MSAQQWVFCHSCRKCIDSRLTHRVELLPELGGHIYAHQPMIPANVCGDCYSAYFDPAIKPAEVNE
jgi:hypothetical protein